MTFVAVAFCPHPPLLVPEVGRGEPVAVRGPALAAVQWLTRQPIQQLVVLGSGDAPACYVAPSAGGFSGYGVHRPVTLPGPVHTGTASSARSRGPASVPTSLPLPLAVAAWLLEEVGWMGPTVGWTCAPDGTLPRQAADRRGAEDGRTDRGDGLLVMGDGSARRSEKAPGWLDERSTGYDAAVSAALAAGDPERLPGDLAYGAELLAAGAPAWAAAARLLNGPRWQGVVSYDDAPYGVGYLVATWSRAPAS